MRSFSQQLQAVTASVIIVFATNCGSGGGSGGSPTAPGGPSCLDTAVFGEPDASPYVLPYEVGESNRLLQSYCSNGSHNSQLAYDFTMPFGAPVVAARRGVVVTARDHFPDDGMYSQNFNLVIIEHPDGTGGIYAHLRQGSLRVGLGDQIQRGEHFADGGTSGTDVPCNWDCAILHFQVSRTPMWLLLDDVGVNFFNTEGPLDGRNGLISGEDYLALPANTKA